MKFHKTTIDGAWLIETEPRVDERGAFARMFCTEEFKSHGLENHVAQCNFSSSRQAGTIRGLHFQRAPAAEVKFVRAQRGAIWDVIVDMRAESPTYLSWYGVELTAENGLALYVPRGFAHGYMSLVDDAEVYYQVSAPYTPQLEGGIRWDDPAVGIQWPRSPTVISDKDRAWPYLKQYFLSERK